MIQSTRWLALLGVVMLAGAPDAQAQMLNWEDKGYLTVNAGAQSSSQAFTETSTPTIYGESGSITTPHAVGGGSLIDFSAGIRVWKNLAIGAGYWHVSDAETPTVTVVVPHPLEFSRPRTRTASTGELKHSESAIHLQALWMIPISDKIEIAAVLGPTFFNIKQDLVGNVTIGGEAPPFEVVTITGVETVTVSERATGFAVGVDGTYLFTPRIGAGGFLRFASASADLADPGGDTVTVEAGGLQVGVGVRVRF